MSESKAPAPSAPKMSIEELSIFAEGELGFPVYLAPRSAIFAVILDDDFMGVIPNSNVHSLDDLRSYITDVGAARKLDEATTIAKYLANGIYADVRALEYAEKTRKDKQVSLSVDAAKAQRTKYDEMLKVNPRIADDVPMLLSLQKSYGVIDNQTYELMLKNFNSLQAAIKVATDKAVAEATASFQKKA